MSDNSIKDGPITQAIKKSNSLLPQVWIREIEESDKLDNNRPVMVDFGDEPYQWRIEAQLTECFTRKLIEIQITLEGVRIVHFFLRVEDAEEVYQEAQIVAATLLWSAIRARLWKDNRYPSRDVS